MCCCRSGNDTFAAKTSHQNPRQDVVCNNRHMSIYVSVSSFASSIHTFLPTLPISINTLHHVPCQCSLPFHPVQLTYHCYIFPTPSSSIICTHNRLGRCILAPCVPHPRRPL